MGRVADLWLPQLVPRAGRSADRRRVAVGVTRGHSRRAKTRPLGRIDRRQGGRARAGGYYGGGSAKRGKGDEPHDDPVPQGRDGLFCPGDVPRGPVGGAALPGHSVSGLGRPMGTGAHAPKPRRVCHHDHLRIAYPILPRFAGKPLHSEIWAAAHFWIAALATAGMVIGFIAPAAALLLWVGSIAQFAGIVLGVVNIWLTIR